MVLLAALVAGPACGDNAAPGDGPGDGEDPIADGLRVRQVSTIPHEQVRGLALAALAGDRLAIARADASGDAFCPDCLDLPASECPALCIRSTISVAVLDPATGGLAPSRPVATVFPASFDHSVDQLEIVALGGDRLGVAWLDCDDARCGGLAAKRSCAARYTTVDLATGAVGTPRTLYEGWFGDLSLAFDPVSRRLLAVIGKDLAFGAGLFRALFDETGATTLSPWTALGSTAARSPALLATGGAFLVVADDWAPTSAPLATPCPQSCDCLASVGIDLATGGLFAFHVGDGPDRSERIADGVDDRGFYGRREQIAVIDAGGRTMIADTQSIDRSAEIFTNDGTGWVPQLRSPAPIPMWIGALGTAERLAWIGARPEPGGFATVQRLVAGVVTEDAEHHAAFTEPVDGAVLVTLPVATPAGVTTTYLVRGVFAPRVGPQLGWDRFELLAVDAVW